VDKVKCPLNVCCSKSGYCGTTKDFCGDKKVDRPASCDKGINRVVGYYEGWAYKRPCNKFLPEQIPINLYSVLNYAFATIDPVTFAVKAPTKKDEDMMQRLIERKKFDKGLKVFIAIGGWTFNDPGPTATTFSDIARSSENRAAFIKSLLGFMMHYGFDGVDLDWEYPQADDRSGRPEDFDNFVELMSQLKLQLRLYGYQVSITLPASYWYLQHFDIVRLQLYVDFFNMMTYDLHGTWDIGSKHVKPELNAHTNLTEIKTALDLLWRNKINPEKVVLGLAFYGRAVVPSDPGCTTAGCLFASGAPRLPCSGEISVALNSEIDDIISKENIKPSLNKDAAVKLMTYGGGNWVSFDDGDTFKMKIDFAKSQCLGGVMVWAVSHDTKDSKYSSALGKALGRVPALPSTGDGTEEVTTNHLQCKWTGCGQACPSNWLPVFRSGPGSTPGSWEYMKETEGCEGTGGAHTFCCPPGEEHPVCGWYTHNNGACKSGCPSGYSEVGANGKHCNNGDYQSACCSSEDQNNRGVKNLLLYSKCNWGDKPRCEEASCGDGRSKLLGSMNGPGAGECIIGDNDWQSLQSEERKYCCDTGNSNERWGTCEWFTQGFRPANDPDYCGSECPDNMVRVAMEKYGGGCRSGARAKCCTPEAKTITKRDTAQTDYYKKMLKTFMEDPTCPNDMYGGLFNQDSTPILRERSLSASVSVSVSGGAAAESSLTTSLELRASTKKEAQDIGLWLASYLFLQIRESNHVPVANYMRQMWNDAVTPTYEWLTYDNLSSYLKDTIEAEWMREHWSDIKLGNYIACNLDAINSRIRKKKDSKSSRPWVCWCYGYECGCGQNLCPRSLSRSSPTSPAGHTVSRRADDKSYIWEAEGPDGATYLGKFTSQDWPKPADFNFDSWVWQNTYVLDTLGDCPETSLQRLTWEGIDVYIDEVNGDDIDRTPEDFVNIEHYVEKNAPSEWVERVIEQKLYGDDPFPSAAGIPPDFFTNFMSNAQLDLFLYPTTLGATNEAVPQRRFMHTLGTKLWFENFLLLQDDVNIAKASILDGKDPVASDKMTGHMENDPLHFVTRLRLAFGVLNYLNEADALDFAERSIHGIRWELRVYQHIYNQQHNTNIDVVTAWDDWYKAYMQARTLHAKSWILDWLDKADVYYRTNQLNYAHRALLLQCLSVFRTRATGLEGYNYDWYPTGVPAQPRWVVL
jgi:chitinase